ncbi:MAG: ferredoxin [Nocardioides sp.]|uniref:ferredoxin n=1 Tax=Nocardioides sp. TaxID=35761 RepID=UPI0039E68BFC
MTERQRRVRADVDHDLCVGVGMCVQLAPGDFDFDADGQGVFLPDGPSSDEQLQEAAENCPMAAIRLIAEEAPS